MTRRAARCGYTLFELIVIMAILVLLAAVLIPGVAVFRGDTRHRAAGDVIRGELATARARAKEEGRPYRIAISEDGKRIRRAPDDDGFAEAGAFESAHGSSAAVDYPFDDVIAAVVPEKDAAPPASANGWVTLATVQPDGTCREDNVLVSIKDENGMTLYLRIRGVTCRTYVVPNPAANAKRGAQ